MTTPSPESRYRNPTGELRQFGDGSVDQVYKNPGDEFSMGALVRAHQLDPVAQGAGSIVVQTGTKEAGDHKRHYIDGEYVLVDRGEHSRPVALDTKQLYDPAFDIKIGQPWYAPDGGVNGVVTAVVVPYTGVFQYGESGVGDRSDRPHSFTAEARQKLHQATGRPEVTHEPVSDYGYHTPPSSPGN